jgi:hypothetical protein
LLHCQHHPSVQLHQQTEPAQMSSHADWQSTHTSR